LTVKEKTGRRRYVAASFVPAPSGGNEIIRLLSDAMGRTAMLEARVRFISMNANVAIIRCVHSSAKSVVAGLNRIDGRYRCSTLCTSGTLKSLRLRLGQQKADKGDGEWGQVVKRRVFKVK
jgi:RNase P/RNase MRP subunit POP5